MPASEFQCPIQMQPKLAVLVPAYFLAAIVGGGWLLYFLVRRGVLPESVGAIGSTVLFFMAFAAVITVSLAKGQVEVDARQVTVRRGLAGTVTVERSGAELVLTRWKSYVHWTRWMEAGPQLKISSGGRSVTVACLGPEMTAGLPSSGARIMDLPMAVVSPEDFQALLAALGLEPGAGGG